MKFEGKEPSSYRADGAWCAVAIVAAILIVHPAAEMAFVDEWSYVGSSLAFTKGRIAYYGASAMVGWQIPWGTLFFKLFGFSFTVARTSMLPFASGAVFLMHQCLRGFGVRRRGAVLGALTLGLSPLYLPLAASFMTDIGALFGVLLCLHLCLRAIAATSDRSTVRLLTLAALLNLVLGTDRQIVWLGTLVMVPGTAWLLRRRHGVVAATIVLWSVSFVAILLATHWFGKQVNILPAKLTGPVGVHALLSMVRQVFIRVTLCLALLVLPVAIAGLARLDRLSRAAWIRVTAAGLVIAGGYGALYAHHLLEHAIVPWAGPFIGNLGMWRQNDEMPGLREVTLGVWPRAVLSVVVLLSVVVWLEWLWAGRARGSAAQEQAELPQGAGWRAVFWTIGLYSAAYVMLLVPTQLFGSGFYDRYVLFLMPLGLIVLLKFYEERLRGELPALCYGVLAVFGMYTVAATHDWYALLRAHVGAVDEVRAAGVPRTAILAGWEYDAWTQIEEQDYLNYPQAVRRAGEVYTKPPARSRSCEQGLVDWTPAIHPRYVIAYSPVSCFAASEFAPYRYRTWLPPFERTLTVLRVPLS